MSLKNLLGISLDEIRADKAQAAKLGDLVPDANAVECLTSARELLAHMRAWLKANKPELL